MTMKHFALFPLGATILLGATSALSSCGCSVEVTSYELKTVEVLAAQGADNVKKLAETALLFKNQEGYAYAAPETFFNTEEIEVSESKGVFTYSNPSFKIVFDSEKDSVSIDNYEGMINPFFPSLSRIDTTGEFLSFDESKSKTEKTGKTLTYDFASYGFDIISYEVDGKNMCFAPLTPLAATMSGGNCLANYNGTSFFMGLPNFLINDETGELTAAGEAYYGGSYSSRNTYGKEFAEYNYNCLAFAFDHFNSYGEEMGVTDFRKFFKEKGVEGDLKSTDPDTVSQALAKTMYGLIDEGHNGYLTSSFREKGLINSKKEGSTLVEDYIGPRNSKRIDERKKMYEYKKPYVDENGAYPFYQTSGDTAMIYFPSFVASSYIAQQKSPLDDISSTYGILYNGFRLASENSDVKNVVINIADNGGGDAPALLQALGFLSKDGVAHATDKIYNTSSYSEEYYHVDTNADGKYDEKDGYGNKFDNIYILESPVSFSCGNALPYYAKNDGTAKIIGSTSGGGHAVVDSFFLPSGDSICYSGNTVLGAKDASGKFVSNDKGATPDYEISDMSIAFDVKKVADFVSGLNK